MKNYTFRIIIEPDKPIGYHGFVPLLRGVHTCGKTIDDVKRTMTDPEITKLCAGGMGYRVMGEGPQWGGLLVKMGDSEANTYDPLHDDAQAMALVKKFELDCHRHEGVEWVVENRHGELGEYAYGANKDLNRAICECVYKALTETRYDDPQT